MNTYTAERFLSPNEVCERLNIKRSTLYLLIQNNLFPAPVKIGRLSRWREREVDYWIVSQCAAVNRTTAVQADSARQWKDEVDSSTALSDNI